MREEIEEEKKMADIRLGTEESLMPKWERRLKLPANRHIIKWSILECGGQIASIRGHTHVPGIALITFIMPCGAIITRIKKRRYYIVVVLLLLVCPLVLAYSVSKIVEARSIVIPESDEFKHHPSDINDIKRSCDDHHDMLYRPITEG